MRHIDIHQVIRKIPVGGNSSQSPQTPWRRHTSSFWPSYQWSCALSRSEWSQIGIHPPGKTWRKVRKISRTPNRSFLREKNPLNFFLTENRIWIKAQSESCKHKLLSNLPLQPWARPWTQSAAFSCPSWLCACYSLWPTSSVYHTAPPSHRNQNPEGRQMIEILDSSPM